MATVMHGRRKGQTKSANTKILPSNCNTNAAPRGMVLPNGTDLRQVTVLTKQDWERIENELNYKQIQEEMIRKMREEREEQKRKSKELIKNWANTIAGQRQRKLQARQIREEKEEAERKEIDIEEAKIQAQLRREAIEKAKTQQYYQTDRVKTFHSALVLTEVLKEREAQLELKRLKEQAMGDQDIEYMKIDRELFEKGILADQEKARQRLELAAKTKDFQIAQINEHMKASEKEKELDLREAEELKKLAVQFQIEKERLDNIRREERLAMLQENMKQIQDVEKMKILQQKQEEEEDEECRIFAAAKRKMMKLRVQKEQEIHDEKQANLEKIREKLAAQMKQKVSDEDTRIRRAAEEAEIKRLEEERAKEEKLLKEIKLQAEHRKKQLLEKEEKKKRDKMEELEILEMRRAADELFRQNEMEKAIRRKQESEALKNFHIDQYNESVNKEEEARRTQLALDKANVELMEKEESQFQEYAQRVIDHCKKGGRNVYPLEKAAKIGSGGGSGPVFSGKVRPSYLVNDKSGVQMPHYQKESTEETKLQINGCSPSKNRLGFVW
ncbi:cilia- and flagella- associated protein 210-like [Biomphalaria glabrata]|uniref:Cilia- and flagella- associated protein 210-like n=1 Tax=Biomphalaria glabrata TaxID=6526 RepID=A0A9U8E5P3_BIOGL|nr:cilia- and flagella- associated protein 210-like [Biomphalaria glabrata]KAI8793239.1 coiled-coil domain-containing protein 173 [Biomphalaria glabrata]